MKYTPRQPDSNVNVTPTSPLKDFFVLSGGLLVIIVAVYFLLAFAVNLIVPHITPETEKKMTAIFGNLAKTKTAYPEKQSKLQALLDSIQRDCAKLPYDFKIHIKKADTLNALAMPGGHIIVFTALLDKVTSENELAYILGHELGHYANRDHLRGLGRALVFMTVSVVLFGTDSSMGNMAGHVLNISEMSFSRRQEAKADEFGLEMLNCTYGHVGGATDFFSRISKEKDPSIFGHYFSSHPENQDRIKHVNLLIKERSLKKEKLKTMF